VRAGAVKVQPPRVLPRLRAAEQAQPAAWLSYSSWAEFSSS